MGCPQNGQEVRGSRAKHRIERRCALTSRLLRLLTGVLVGGIFIPSLLVARQPEQSSGGLETRGSVTPEGILIFQSADGQFSCQLDGRVFLDAAFYAGDKSRLGNGAELRRGRLAVISRLWKDWVTQLDVDVADNQVSVKDAWIGYEGLRSSSITVGNFKEPFSLEELTSSRYLTFMERALPNAFAPSRHLGIGYSTWRDKWRFAAGLFGQSVGDQVKGADQGYGFTGRLTYAPIRDNTRTVHLGVAGSFRTPDADVAKPDRVQFRSLPEAHLDRTRFLDTGRLRDVAHFTLLGLEAAAVFGPVSLQGEYIKSAVKRKNGAPDVNFDGSYVSASWFVTGESRPYIVKDGEFGRIIPRRKSGALEVAVRYSMLDLNDFRGGITGGKATNITLGSNWYLNPNIRIMANYMIVNNDAHADAAGTLRGDDDFKVFQMRFQLNF